MARANGSMPSKVAGQPDLTSGDPTVVLAVQYVVLYVDIAVTSAAKPGSLGPAAVSVVRMLMSASIFVAKATWSPAGAPSSMSVAEMRICAAAPSLPMMTLFGSALGLARNFASG